MMWKEIIERKRWIIMVPIVMVILLLISLEVYVDIKSQKIDEEYGVHYMPYRDDIDSIGSDICFDVTAIGAEYGEIDFSSDNIPLLAHLFLLLVHIATFPVLHLSLTFV